jgi:hypothetical protein
MLCVYSGCRRANIMVTIEWNQNSCYLFTEINMSLNRDNAVVTECSEFT